ncbi:MAG: hypothetical protein ABSF45_07335 [Terriglobia bacterium]|jgi:hypothetical protein
MRRKAPRRTVVINLATAVRREPQDVATNAASVEYTAVARAAKMEIVAF